MKKISFLIGSLGGGGAERVTVALADYFCENGYEVFFIVFQRQIIIIGLIRKLKLIICLRIQENVQYFLE